MRNNPLRGVVREESNRDEVADRMITLILCALLSATVILILITDFIW
jgi:hypothetical protein